MNDDSLYETIKRILQEIDQADQRVIEQLFRNLITLIPKLQGIKKSCIHQIEYQEAFNLACTNVWDKIVTFPKLYNLEVDNANPVHVRVCFVKWFNKILQRRMVDLYRQIKKQPLTLDICSEIDDKNSWEQMENQEVSEILTKYLEEDPDGILQFPLEVRGVAKCTCQDLINRRLLSEPTKTWRDIAQELDVPQGTLTAFWHRKCMPILQQIPEKLGIL